MHVNELPILQPAQDIDIWHYALTHDFVIITQDKDFATLSDCYGFPPKVIWLTTGNRQLHELRDLFTLHIESIKRFVYDLDSGFLEVH